MSEASFYADHLNQKTQWSKPDDLLEKLPDVPVDDPVWGINKEGEKFYDSDWERWSRKPWNIYYNKETEEYQSENPYPQGTRHLYNFTDPQPPIDAPPQLLRASTYPIP